MDGNDGVAGAGMDRWRFIHSRACVYRAGSLMGVSAVYTMLAAFSKSATNACASVSLVGLELAMQGVGNQNVREVGVHPG